MKLLLILLGAYLLLINLDAFILMASDKSRARRGKRRIPEATLFLVAVLGGSLGIIAGMYAFRPVSYTHLDVYKRQPWSRGCGRARSPLRR